MTSARCGPKPLRAYGLPAPMIAGLLALVGCSSVPSAPPSGPFAVEGVGPAMVYIYPAEIEKDLTRRVGPSCPNGFDVMDVVTRRNSGRKTSNLIRYRAIVQCRPEAMAEPSPARTLRPRY